MNARQNLIAALFERASLTMTEGQIDAIREILSGAITKPPRDVDLYDEAIADVCAAIADDAWWRDEVTGGGGQQNLTVVRKLLIEALVAGTAKGKAKL